MTQIDSLEDRTNGQLLALYARVLGLLDRRGVVRSKNNPVGDYAEHLACEALDLTRAGKSCKGYDATDGSGKRYQVKGRRMTDANPSRQLSALRGLEDYHFDYLVGVLFKPDFTVLKACVLPHAVVMENARWHAHVNAHRFLLCDRLWNDARVRDVTYDMQMLQ